MPVMGCRTARVIPTGPGLARGPSCCCSQAGYDLPMTGIVTSHDKDLQCLRMHGEVRGRAPNLRSDVKQSRFHESFSKSIRRPKDWRKPYRKDAGAVAMLRGGRCLVTLDEE